MQHNKSYPLKHLSIRVPWHDQGWNGTICEKPKSNSSCLILKNCAENRDDDREDELAGELIAGLSEQDYPVCVRERGTFMCDFSFTTNVNHPYKENNNPQYQHFKETSLRHSPYSAFGVPFLWLQREVAQQKADYYDLDVDLTREPELNFHTIWLQEYSNQKAMLDCFFEHVEVNNSLCFFYAKEVPFVEKSGRVLIGVGRVKHVGDGTEYEYSAHGALRCMLWEHQIQHSIRPGFKDGFLLPYHEAVNYASEHEDFDPAEVAVMAPSDKIDEFSYATEHVSNDTAIRVLLDCVKSLEKAKELNLGNSDWEEQLKWLHERINELEIIRGPYPGLGSALTAFGIDRGHFVAREIVDSTKENEFWDAVDKMFDEPGTVLSEPLAKRISSTLQKRWQLNKAKSGSEKIELLQLLSRFDLTIEQAKNIYVAEEREKHKMALTDRHILENPYLIFEQSNKFEKPVSFWTIDLGIYSRRDKSSNLLPASADISDYLDSRRIRALTLLHLSSASNMGHTLLARNNLVLKIREMTLSPPCEIAGDIYEIAEEIFPNVIEQVEYEDGSPAYQLAMYKIIGNLIEDTVVKRKCAKRHHIDISWEELLVDNQDQNEEIRENASKEQALALKEMAESRISVLTGSAGTGKTTLLSTLCEQEEIKKDGILFLAPTGKARVRLQDAASKADARALTLAQFLGQYKRYDARKAIYELSDYEKCSQYGTVIVDEASMMTEEMMGALFDALKGVKRYIFVGDYRQLPPIGAGRPFVDIVKYLQPDNIEAIFPRVAPSFAELTVTHRQKETIGNSSYQHDMLLAKWFSGMNLAGGDDQIFQDLLLKKQSDRLTVHLWQDENELWEKLQEALVIELNLKSIDDIEGFNKALGSVDGKFFNDSGKAKYFNQSRAIDKLEDWQILSPVRKNIHGSNEFNRVIHQMYKKKTIDYCYGYNLGYPPRLPEPLGNEEIVYGDKVINVINHRVNKKRVYPQDGLNYIANGEMGYVIGQYKIKKAKYPGQPKFTEVEFSSQKGYKYTFYPSDFKEEGDSPLELAYAITVHKAQGSDFKTTFVIIPKPCFNLSRELLYTALTRQKEKVIIFFQGNNIMELKEYASPMLSETNSRLTSLFTKPNVEEISGRYLEKYLIHCASDKTLLRSKSELLIYEKLLAEGLEPIYEKELTMGGFTRIPDFTITDDDTGETYFWEHCGMLNNPEYRKRWEAKKKWYYENGILPLEDGGGPNGILIITQDSPNEGISMPEIESILGKIT